jgi:hypothetical protein
MFRSTAAILNAWGRTLIFSTLWHTIQHTHTWKSPGIGRSLQMQFLGFEAAPNSLMNSCSQLLRQAPPELDILEQYFSLCPTTS